MKLGNSGGNNTGKKYLKRDSLNYDKLTGEDYARLDNFNTWYTDNIALLESEFREKNSYDEDIINDTYATICESILFSRLEIEDYKSYFSRAYFTNNIQSKIKERRYLASEQQQLESSLNHVLANWENDTEKQALIDEIIEFVKKNHKPAHSDLFIQYISLEKRNYEILSLQTGIKAHIIQRIISNIKVNIRANIKLTNKRKQIQ